MLVHSLLGRRFCLDDRERFSRSACANMEDFSIIFTSFSIFSKSISFSPYIRLLKQPAESFCDKAALKHFPAWLINLPAQFIESCHFIQQKLLCLFYCH